MTADKSFDLGFFPPQINFWYDTSNTLHGHWRELVAIERLPELNPKLDARLTALIPALNQAKTDLCVNISRGTAATWKFAEGLTEAAKNYGMTAEEAEELARDWSRR